MFITHIPIKLPFSPFFTCDSFIIIIIIKREIENATANSIIVASAAAIVTFFFNREIHLYSVNIIM